MFFNRFLHRIKQFRADLIALETRLGVVLRPPPPAGPAPGVPSPPLRQHRHASHAQHGHRPHSHPHSHSHHLFANPTHHPANIPNLGRLPMNPGLFRLLEVLHLNIFFFGS